jgi:hypothetical protein
MVGAFLIGVDNHGEQKQQSFQILLYYSVIVSPL